MPKSFNTISRDYFEIVFTNRHGGCSSKPYDSLNLGTHVGDDLGDVFRNRELLQKEVSKSFEVSNHDRWLFLNQTHENNLVVVNDDSVINNETPPTADASVTRLRRQPLVVMTADCGPLVIAGKEIISVIHASWKSLASGIVASVIEEMQYSAPQENLVAYLGPCIHPQSYEFDQKLLADLADRLGPHIISETLEGKPAFNLPAGIKHECEANDVKFESSGIDTFSNRDYFSYRRDGQTGRQGVIAWLK